MDFLCSPNSYVGVRDPDADWTEMYPADSVRLHGKLCMQECDVRTHLTRLLSEAAPEYDMIGRYTAPIWLGPESREASLQMLRKTFSRQLVKGNGFWWFDMWGGWYHDPVLLEALGDMRALCAESLTKENRGSVARFAVFIDESAMKYMTDCALRGAVYHQRTQLGLMGAPYDMFDVRDFEAVFRRYKAVMFTSDCETPAMRRALALCEATGTPYLSLSAGCLQYSAAQLRGFCKACGVHVYCETDDIVYVSGRYLALYAVEAGEKTVVLPGVCAYRELLAAPGLRGEAGTLRFYMRAHDTKLFEYTRTAGEAL